MSSINGNPSNSFVGKFKPQELHLGDIVQINPQEHRGHFGGCLMTVISSNPTVSGIIYVPNFQEQIPYHYYYHATWNEIDLVGKAIFVFNENEVKEDNKSGMIRLEKV